MSFVAFKSSSTWHYSKSGTISEVGLELSNIPVVGFEPGYWVQPIYICLFSFPCSTSADNGSLNYKRGQNHLGWEGGKWEVEAP